MIAEYKKGLQQISSEQLADGKHSRSKSSADIDAKGQPPMSLLKELVADFRSTTPHHKAKPTEMAQHMKSSGQVDAKIVKAQRERPNVLARAAAQADARKTPKQVQAKEKHTPRKGPIEPYTTRKGPIEPFARGPPSKKGYIEAKKK